MALSNETVNVDTVKCSECGKLLHIEVLRSAAGYYIGFFCPNDGPYSRESEYFGTRKEAQEALDTGEF